MFYVLSPSAWDFNYPMSGRVHPENKQTKKCSARTDELESTQNLKGKSICK